MIRSFVGFNRGICRKLEKAFPTFFGDPRDYNADQLNIISDLINNLENIRILEAGGVDRPLLKRSQTYTYVGMDIDEKPTCYECYDEFVVQSIEHNISDEFDLIISSTLLEHVRDNSKSIKMIYGALKNGGSMVHYVPSKYHFYSLCLRIVGPNLQKILIKYLRPEAAAITGYPAFFNGCSPVEMRKLCQSAGFKDIEFLCYYKATDYFAFFVPAFIFVSIFENIFQYFKLTTFCSGFIVCAKK